jgi:hypothetical protein
MFFDDGYYPKDPSIFRVSPEAPTNVSRIGIAKIRFCPISHSSFFRDDVEMFFCNVECILGVNSNWWQIVVKY